MYHWEKPQRDRKENQNPSFSSTLLDNIYRSIDEKGPTVQQNAKQKHQLWSLLDHNSPTLQYHYDALLFTYSSDTDSLYIPKHSNSDPTRISKTERRAPNLFYEQRELRVIDDYHFRSSSDHHTPKPKPKPKSKSLNLKKPNSPGGRLASFLNSIFTGTPKKSRNPEPVATQRVSKSAQSSSCSSVSSFSRSCLSKKSPASREELRNGVKRSVRFCPVRVAAEETRPVRETELKSRKVEELARDFLKQYRENQNKINGWGEIDEDDDDDASCASSDLFELDHLAIMGSEKYREELPVYETTRFDRNPPFSNGLFV